MIGFRCRIWFVRDAVRLLFEIQFSDIGFSHFSSVDQCPEQFMYLFAELFVIVFVNLDVLFFTLTWSRCTFFLFNMFDSSSMEPIHYYLEQIVVHVLEFNENFLVFGTMLVPPIFTKPFFDDSQYLVDAPIFGALLAPQFSGRGTRLVMVDPRRQLVCPPWKWW